MNNLLTTLLALAALAAGTAVAILESAPLVTDTLTGAGLGTLIGSAVTYRRERIAARQRRPAAIKGSWIVVRWSIAARSSAPGRTCWWRYYERDEPHHPRAWCRPSALRPACPHRP